MAKQKPGQKPGFRSLQKRYKEQSTKLRVASSDKTTYQSLIRSYRHEVALAKKKGLLSPTIDARKVVPTSNLTRQLERAQSVAPFERVQKVSAKVAKQLRDEGYTVIRDRVVLAQNMRVNKKGQLIDKEISGDTSRYIPKRLTANFEEEIRKVFDGLKDNESIAAQFPNDGMTNTYSKGALEIFISKFKQYVTDSHGNIRNNLKYVYLKVLTKAGVKEWQAMRALGNKTRIGIKKKRTSLKRKEKRMLSKRK
jgi:hypothetical protein